MERGISYKQVLLFLRNHTERFNRIMTKLIFLFTLFLSVNAMAQNSPERFPPVQIILSPDSPNWEYQLGKQAKVEVQVLQYGVAVNQVTINYQLANDLMKTDTHKEMTLPNGIGMIKIQSMREPGFRQLKVSCMVDGKNYKQEVKLGFSPEKIQPTVEEPQDFDNFWNKTICEARSRDLDVQLQELNDYSTNDVKVYLWSISTGIAHRRISGYLCKPNDDEKHPVLFTPPGAGVKSIKPYLGFAKDGYISLSIEIHGVNPLPDKERYQKAKSVLGDYWKTGMNSKDDYYYKAVYAGCVRVVDYLCSLPQYNGNCVVTGGSQGGALAIITTALNDKVDAVAAFYPALSDIPAFLHGRGGGWPQLFKDKEASDAQIQTLAYYDVVNFAKRIKVPGFYSTGFNDNTVCPTSVFAAFNQITAPKTMYITPPTGHWRFGISNEKSLSFLRNQCNR